MEFQELLDRYNLTIVDKPDKIEHNTKLVLVSSDGYKYFLSRDNLSCANRRGSVLCKYFRNPYTEDNLNNFLRIETNGDVFIKDFQNAQNAHDPILLHCNSNNLDYIKSSNEITTGRYYLKKQMPGYEPSSRLGLERVKVKAEKYGIEIVDTSYTNNATPLKFVCLKHRSAGVQEKPWAYIQRQKNACKYCESEYNIIKWELNPPPARIGGEILTSSAKERFEMESERFKNPFVEIVGEYTRAHEKIECRCLKCGEIFYLRPDHIRRGIGHSGCNKSLGEERLEKYLKEHNISYVGQYRFGDCIRKERDMPFDFYLPDLNIAIEYDGIQHYGPVVKFGGEEGFAELKLNDYYKTNYCAEHGVELVRVPYTEYNNMEAFLDDYFKNKRS